MIVCRWVNTNSLSMRVCYDNRKPAIILYIDGNEYRITVMDALNLVSLLTKAIEEATNKWGVSVEV